MKSPRPSLASLLCLLSASFVPLSSFAASPPPAAGDAPAQIAPPKASSEDSLIANYHSMGKIANRSNIYRCANPVGKVTERLKGAEPTEADRAEARQLMQHLYDSGVRTVVSLQRQDVPTATEKNPEYAEVVLEKKAAEEVGITYVAYSMANKGKVSLQYMSNDEVAALVTKIGDDIVKRSETGGVAFHCKSGKDRTGLVAGYLRIKYQDWTVDQALVEMREKGHVWKKFLKPGNTYSWHEEHLKAIGQTFAAKPQ